jgi:hypothetical protein
MHERIREYIKGILPDIRVLIADGGTEVELMTAGELRARLGESEQA